MSCLQLSKLLKMYLVKLLDSFIVGEKLKVVCEAEEIGNRSKYVVV